jgi:hypothetical protein
LTPSECYSPLHWSPSPFLSSTPRLSSSVRGHPSVSLLPLSSPTSPLFICTPPTPLYHLQGPHSKANNSRTHNLMTFQKSTHWMSSTSCIPLCSYLSSIGQA